MKQQLQGDTYVDLIDLFCGQEMQCLVVDENLKLISFDGGHLTPEGAFFFGNRLKEHPIIGKWIAK
jgi:hypothetical protein